MRKNCSSDRGKLLKFEAEGREFEKKIRTVGQNNFGNKILLLLFSIIREILGGAKIRIRDWKIQLDLLDLVNYSFVYKLLKL